MTGQWASTLRSCWPRDAHRGGRSSRSRQLPRMPSQTVAAGPTCAAQRAAQFCTPGSRTDLGIDAAQISHYALHRRWARRGTPRFRRYLPLGSGVVGELGSVAGHAFLSYVREDTDRADDLQQILEAAGVQVWRDTTNLWPGEDWRAKIRLAITQGAFVFIACFSCQGIARQVSFQREELRLAIEQLTLRRPDVPWLVPVRFDDCDIPDLDIGTDRTLRSIQRADLFGDNADEGAVRLVTTVLRALGQYSPDPPRQLSFDFSDAKRLARFENEERRARAAVLEAARRESETARSFGGSDSSAKILLPTAPPQRPVNLCLLGPSACGKTTYLAVLDIAVARAASDLLMRGIDEGTEDFLHNATTAIARRQFPMATSHSQPVRLTLAGSSLVHAGNAGSQASVIPAELNLDLIDTHSLAFQRDASGDYDYMIRVLAKCDGLILMYDPGSHADYREFMYESFQGLGSLGMSLPLPFDVAVCIAKFDDPDIYGMAVAGNHVTVPTTPMSQISGSRRAASP